MNTWTNNKYLTKKDSGNKEIKQKKTKMGFRPRTGNPSPTKMDDDSNDKLGNGQIMFNYNLKQNQFYSQKQSFQTGNEAVILRSYSNTKQNITPVSIQSQMLSNNPPQPHQRHIK